MKKITLLFIALASFMTACDDDTTPVALTPPIEEAEGEWHLIQVSGSIAGVTHLFEPGTIIWTFNEDGTVDIENTNTDDTVEDFFETGTYDYSYVPNEAMNEMCDIVLRVENTDLGCQEMTEQHLTLTQAVADGYVLKFTKM